MVYTLAATLRCKTGQTQNQLYSRNPPGLKTVYPKLDFLMHLYNLSRSAAYRAYDNRQDTR